MLSRLITRKEQLVLLALAGAISLGSLALYFHHEQQPPPDSSSQNPAGEPPVKPKHGVSAPASTIAPAPPLPAPAPADTTVSITGAVQKPGVYTLDANARVQDLIEKAGGPLDDANLDELNLAAKLLDGTTLNVPAKPAWDAKLRRYVYAAPPAPSYNPPQYTRSGWVNGQATSGPPAATGAGESSSGNGAINLNTATQQQLESLPGIGPKLAQQIISQRANAPFQSVEDLDKVPGFGPRRIEQIRRLVTVR